MALACTPGDSDFGSPEPPDSSTTPSNDLDTTPFPDAPPTGDSATGDSADDDGGSSEEHIVVHVDDIVGEFDRRLLGTNVPAWLGPEMLADRTFQQRVVELGTTLLRLPGGSWSNHYDWLACERGDDAGCFWTWAARPSDFLDLLDATGIPAMWTVSINGTAEEAAAIVAFFNGDVDDNRRIGLDRRGRDWRTVGEWASLRADLGHPEPLPIRLWEVGNEVFGAVPAAGPACASFGWEEVWTCDGAEYALGTDEHDGFVQFADAMRAVDADIDIGAVGVGDADAWSAWDHHVIAAAGDMIDFYVVHHYGYDGSVDPSEALSIPSRAWPAISGDVRATFERHHPGRSIPIAVTEHNLVSSLDLDLNASMTTSLNAFYLAETIGQMAMSGVPIANQWNLANGRHENGSDYGLIDADTLSPTPAFHALAAWSHFGEPMLAVDKGGALALRPLRVYASADGNDVVAVVVNPVADAIATTLVVESATAPLAETTIELNVAQSTSLSDIEMTTSSSTIIAQLGTAETAFAPFSITVMRWSDGALTSP
jgi:hypothetical protein